MLLGVPFLVPVGLRHTGEWSALRRAIKIKEAELRKYQRAHPDLTKEQVVAGFLAEGGASVVQFLRPHCPTCLV